MFYDYAKIYVKGGDGGNGIVAFRREKYVPLGGPCGGDGGRGGDVIFQGDENLSTLMDFKYKQHYKAARGEHGKGKNMHGANAAGIVARVPVGTVVKDAESGEVLADIVRDGQRAVAAKGGRGGRGNTRFAGERQKAPHLAENGEPGQERWLILELKLLADVGLVGMPNAGKSTMLSRISSARPKIADYPFTTLVPNLGLVDLGEGQSFVAADLPGLLRGAHSGLGLGHRFLRHIERTKALLHVLDMSGERDPAEDFAVINEELRLYKAGLTARPQIVAANKMDALGADERLAELKKRLAGEYEIFPVSALRGEGLQPLLWRLWQILQEDAALPAPDEEIRLTVVKAEKPEDELQIVREADGLWVVKSAELERLVAMTDLDNEDAVWRMQRIMDKKGLDGALRRAGVQPGDSVRIGKEEFEFT
ncbi:MAG: GTPase ObgE [Clostridiales bacterium]|nr:GTPase ObgE [Clostridiales bacterium]